MPQYGNAIVYVIKNNVNAKVYVGSTTNDVRRRWNEHKHCSKDPKKNAIPIYNAMNELGIDKFTIEVVERFPCENSQQLKNREVEVTRQMDAFENGYNKRIENRTAKQYCRDYYAAHPDKMRALARKYYRENVNEKAEANRKYRMENAAKISAQRKAYREANAAKIKAAKKAYRDRKRAK